MIKVISFALLCFTALHGFSHDIKSSSHIEALTPPQDDYDKIWKKHDKKMNKVRKQFNSKSRKYLYGSWGRPYKISSSGNVYYKYGIVNGQQYYYWFTFTENTENGLITNVSFTDNPL